MAPVVALAACLAVLVTIVWLKYFRDEMRPIWSPELTYSGNLDDQRRMASCYEVGCSTVIATPIQACAWREVILEETDRASPQDIAAANRACQQISTTDRSILHQAELVIREHLHAVHLNSKP